MRAVTISFSKFLEALPVRFMFSTRGLQECIKFSKIIFHFSLPLFCSYIGLASIAGTCAAVPVERISALSG